MSRSFSQINDFKKLVSNFLLLFSIFIFISYGFSLFFAKKIMSESLLNRSEKQFQEQKAFIQNVFFGDSHTSRAINTKILPSTFNFGSLGEHYFQTYFKVKKTVEENPNLRNIFLQYADHNFTAEPTYNTAYYWKEYLNFDLKDKSLTDLKDLPLIFLIRANFFSYYRSLYTFFESEARSPSTVVFKGFQPRFGTRRLTAKDPAGKIKQHFPNDELKFNKINKLYFEKTLDYLANKNIKVFLIKYPISTILEKEFKKKFADATIFSNYSQEISKKYDVPILDFSKVSREFNCTNLNCDNFYDLDHLNISGANIISSYLRRNIFRIENK